MIKKKILMMLALLLTAVTGAWADVSTLYADGVFTGFTATSGTGVRLPLPLQRRNKRK